jgi:steroid Delta-isomerase
MTPHSRELEAVTRFFETLSEQSITDIASLYSADAYFKDPFNEVRGVAQITDIFRQMFIQVSEPRFRVTGAIQNQAEVHGEAFLLWEFSFRFKRFKTDQVQTVRGSSHLRFDTQGKIMFHRDYWDAAEELYEKIPLLGGLMRMLKRRAQH